MSFSLPYEIWAENNKAYPWQLRNFGEISAKSSKKSPAQNKPGTAQVSAISKAQK